MVKKSKLKRERYEIPEFILSALESQSLMEAYRGRPDYQQNDYIGWITRAKLEVTQQKRLEQMLDELRLGGIYMKMAHPPSRRVASNE